MSLQYYVMHGQNVYGPVSASQLKQWATDGHLSPDQQVSPDGKEWVATLTVPGLFPVAVPDAPPPWTPAPVATPMPSSSTPQASPTVDIGQAASLQAPAKDWKREWITTDTTKTPAASAPSPQPGPPASEAKPDFTIPGGRWNPQPQFGDSASTNPPALPPAGAATFGQVSIDLDASVPVPPSAFPAQTLEAATFGRVSIDLGNTSDPKCSFKPPVCAMPQAHPQTTFPYDSTSSSASIPIQADVSNARELPPEAWISASALFIFMLGTTILSATPWWQASLALSLIAMCVLPWLYIFQLVSAICFMFMFVVIRRSSSSKSAADALDALEFISIVLNWISVFYVPICLLGFWRLFAAAGKSGAAAIMPFAGAKTLLELSCKPKWWIFPMHIPVIGYFWLLPSIMNIQPHVFHPACKPKESKWLPDYIREGFMLPIALPIVALKKGFRWIP